MKGLNHANLSESSYFPIICTNMRLRYSFESYQQDRLIQNMFIAHRSRNSVTSIVMSSFFLRSMAYAHNNSSLHLALSGTFLRFQFNLGIIDDLQFLHKFRFTKPFTKPGILRVFGLL